MSAKPGSGRGGTGGQGQGSSPPGEAPPGETGTKEEQVSGQKHDGVMIGSFLEKGTAPTGEAQVEVRDAVRSNLRMAESSLDKERIPAELREVAKKYIEKLNERVQGD